MRIALLSTLIGLSTLLPLQADLLHFESGDLLRGNLSDVEVRSGLEAGSSPAISEEDRLVWASDLLAKDASFALNGLSRIELENPEESEFEINTLVRMANGDVHEGQLKGLNDEEVVLLTGYAGEISIKRWFVTQLRFPSQSQFAYFGPNRLSEWVEHGEEGDWILEDGRLKTKTTDVIALQREGTDQVHISFDAKWDKRADFVFKIFADSAEADEYKNSYDIRFSNGAVYISSTAEGRTVRGGRAFRRNFDRIPELQQSGQGRFDIYAIRSKGQVQVWFDGKLLNSWQDPAQQRPDLGGSLHLVSQSGSEFSIGELEMIPWDGIPPQEGKKSSQDELLLPSSDGDRLVLINGDSVKGSIGELKEGSLGLVAKELKLEVPIERVRLLRLFNPIYVEFSKVPSPRQYNRDVRAQLKSGRRITFRLLGFEDGKLIAYNEASGEIKLSLSAFKELSFGLYPSYGKSVEK